MKLPLIFCSCILLGSLCFGQANYDEAKVPDYTLPSLMISQEGKKISNIDDWQNIRRPELLSLFEQNVYGKIPDFKYEMDFKVGKIDKKALSGKAYAKEVVVSFYNERDTVDMTIMIFLPAKSKKAVPLFLGYNFYGNQSIHPYPEITISESYVNNSTKLGVTGNKVDESSRGMRSSRWAVERILERGYGLAVIHYADVDPDFDDGFKNGIHRLVDEESAKNWPSISAWAWGLSRALDYIETDSKIDEKRIAVFGHSRLGKTSLWAGALDQRFALVISNDSGCGGAALSKRQFGETVQVINTAFPHWFNSKFKEYNSNEANLPIDQHMLIALMAPRPVYVASAVDDRWADPRGEFLSIYHASKAFKLYGGDVMTSDEMPEIDSPVIRGKQAYHIRTGGHDVTSFDWEKYMDFADIHLKKL
ncbi:acetylxylan esterase [Reichenbachiella sp. MALMAid0571]|uniref:glucuronyl esterase domain-containing protein n=1 Tax=Reichenbachiella sp. MALMAid0571 TaxID=3143939 RepID=UPI0032DFB1BA